MISATAHVADVLDQDHQILERAYSSRRRTHRVRLRARSIPTLHPACSLRRRTGRVRYGPGAADLGGRHALSVASRAAFASDTDRPILALTIDCLFHHAPRPLQAWAVALVPGVLFPSQHTPHSSRARDARSRWLRTSWFSTRRVLFGPGPPKPRCRLYTFRRGNDVVLRTFRAPTA
eukprot:GEMP01072846.1.p1 GENE.GEMP01072846.1~~GEMP01072846.1.p1  ORF type:complete len:177 (-),score=27.87 GEMP01072846.1:305-835(-)